MRWRLLPFAELEAAMNMAVDESICDSIRAGISSPTIRLYAWRPSAVTIGCFQSLDHEVEGPLCHSLGIDVVRRRTGGGAVFHGTGSEITYSVICPENVMGNDIGASYRTVCGCVVNALSSLGISSEFRPINDILVKGKKISGSAQTRRDGVFLQHGTVIHSLDDRMFKALKVPKEKLSDKSIIDVRERVTCVLEHSNASIDELRASLIEAFSFGKDIEVAPLTDEERSKAERLAASRYSQESWNNSR